MFLEGKGAMAVLSVCLVALPLQSMGQVAVCRYAVAEVQVAAAKS